MSDDAFFAEIQDGFLQEASDLLGKVEALSLTLEKDPTNESTYAELARLAHNFKGSGKAVGFDHISSLGHRLEDFILAIKNKIIPPLPEQLDFLFKCLDRLKTDIEALILDKTSRLDHSTIFAEIDVRLSGKNEAPKVEVHKQETSPTDFVEEPTFDEIVESLKTSEKLVETPGRSITEKNIIPAATSSSTSSKTAQIEVLRIQKPKIDFLLEAFGEQVILQSTLEQCKNDIDSQKELLIKTISQLSKLTFELQSHALALTMVQLGPTFTKLERATRDAARTCGKTVEIVIRGSETEVDKTLIDQLSDSLTHMVRNAVDHAIEDESTRLQINKLPQGVVTIEAKRMGGQLWIEISDDGKGLDPAALKSKAVKKGIISEDVSSQMTKEDCYQLIFSNGFSTKDQVSEVSGRGVGMNVVSETVSALNGAIEIESEVDKGTIFRLKLPLSLAIFNGAIVRIGSNKFVIPNSEIAEVAKIDLAMCTQIDSKDSAIKIRDEVFRVIDLRQRLEQKNHSARSSILGLKKERLLPVLISRKFGNVAFLIDEILGMQKIVQKPLGDEVKCRPEFAAGTILSDGSPGVILNLHSFCQSA